MTQDIKTIEDCVKLLIENGGIETSDRPIMNSIYRQIVKNVALTDRQYTMLKQKLVKYRNGINQHGDFDLAVVQTSMPIRSVNRSKIIRIGDISEDTQGTWMSTPRVDRKESLWVEIRFPFHKKTIQKIKEFVKQFHPSNYYHKSGSNSHFFILSENTIVPILETLGSRNFEVDQDVLDYYNEVKAIESSAQEFLPMIKNDNIVNMRDSVRKMISSEIFSSTVKMVDRRRRYGITDYGIEPKSNSLLERVAFRKTTDFLSNPDEHRLQDILETVYELDRYPMMVVLEERHANDQLHEIYNELKTYVDSKQQSVLFRQEGNTEFNQFVKDKNLNNWVDSNTKIVYINSNKLPKLLLSGDFSPITCFMYGSTAYRYVDTYIQDHCDLIIYRDTDLSPMRKHSKYYGNL